ncbi:MAG: SAM-dependent methyltransferase, partial [Planctomycetes bacterium]|nr:SAM-dependent methyltransferase [Planctomycetota bacterium]
VKLPGTLEGHSPYNDDLVKDAATKADNLGCRYFFTWNVNRFVLFDRQKYDVPPLDRRIKDWSLGLQLSKPADVGRPDVLAYVRDKFLPGFLSEFAEIFLERKPDWGMPPDDIFIKSLESHLEWPMLLTRDWLAVESERDRTFSLRLLGWMTDEQQWTVLRGDPTEWRHALDRAAQTLCYVLSNRIIFYEAIRVRQPGLPKLAIPPRIADGDAAYKHFQRRFQQAVEATGDYEPLFHPQEQKDWAGPLIFRSPGALDAWRAVLRSVEGYNLRTVPHDVVGKIFQRLISPEERHKFGQHFTHEDVVDVINAFCIRRPDAVVLDPSCGSGSFLVRAYHRKAWLSEQPSAAPGEGRYHKSHQELLQEIFGCDIALFPAHLATLNLAARQIEKEENYPLIARRNFFDVDRGQPFCQVPGARVGKHREMRDVPVPEFHAIVGNPPYVRQELIPRRDQRAPVSQTKEYLQQLVSDAWPGLELSGRSDLHCYFWPAACRFLRDSGYFGFLTSSSWLDVEYGFPLQAWILCHFKLIAIIESTDEPWFEAARVKTCATLLQRCRDEAKRMDNKVRFV